MPNCQIIAICGRMRSGKDVVANFINKTYGYENKKFAAKLKSVCMELFDLSYEQVEMDKKDVMDPRYGKSPRELLQFFGTDMMQFKLQELLPNFGRVFWAKHLLESTKNQNIVISDLRFKHEAEELLKYDPNALIIKVVRNHPCSECEQHISEQEFESIACSATLYNESSIADLHEKVRQLLDCRLG